MDSQPGSRRAYTGTTGIVVVARIIEIVSGMPFNEFVQRRRTTRSGGQCEVQLACR